MNRVILLHVTEGLLARLQEDGYLAVGTDGSGTLSVSNDDEEHALECNVVSAEEMEVRLLPSLNEDHALDDLDEDDDENDDEVEEE